jgi:hypothetical protein
MGVIGSIAVFGIASFKVLTVGFVLWRDIKALRRHIKKPQPLSDWGFVLKA